MSNLYFESIFLQREKERERENILINKSSSSIESVNE